MEKPEMQEMQVYDEYAPFESKETVQEEHNNDELQVQDETGNESGSDSGSDEQEDRQYTDLEEFALTQGWSPEGKKDAKTWLADGQKINEKRVNKLHDEINNLNKKIEDGFKSLNQGKEKQSLSEQLSNVRSQFNEAVEEGDTELANELQEKIFELRSKIQSSDSSDSRKETESDQKPKKPEDDPVFKDWVEENDWFELDPDMNAHATYVFNRLNNKQAERIAQGKAPLTLQQMLNKTAEITKNKFFGNKNNSEEAKKENNSMKTVPKSIQRHTGRSPVNSGQNRNGKPVSNHSFDNMDANAKEAYNAFKVEGLNMKPEEFAKTWHETDQQGNLATRFIGD